MKAKENTTVQEPLVEVLGDRVKVKTGEGLMEYPLRELPEEFIRWQLEYRREVYDKIARGEYVDFHAAHLPVVATSDGQSPFPNIANKGIGFTPKDEYLPYYLDLLEETVSRLDSMTLEESRPLRVKVAREFYQNRDHIDFRRLGLLEIFEGQTFQNLKVNPFATLLFTGVSPIFWSFEIHALVEILTPDHPRYRFSWGIRRLFEYEDFHPVQTLFPYSYTFWIVEASNKTPKTRRK